MKKIYLFLLLLIVSHIIMAAPVDREKATVIALNYYAHVTSNKTADLSILSIEDYQVEGSTVFYIFRFQSGGFIMVSADDACIPVLGYSADADADARYLPENVKMWFDNYGREIKFIAHAKLPNTQTITEWDNIAENKFPKALASVSPLLSTTWAQGCYYNDLCPADAGGPCSHALVGCVAVAMGQIMKYWNYPPTGTGSYSYTHPTYGLQSANFGATTYNWSSMPNNVSSTNTAVATLLRHCGVSVDMDYGPTGSGAYSADIPYALINYFSYENSAHVEYLADYTTADWKLLLKAELNASRPVEYFGNDGTSGHAFVCDGYDNSDNFHFNWGWSGSYNGYFAIGALNPGTYTFNNGNGAVVGICPPQGSVVNETVIGTTRYDKQTNAAVQNRLQIFSDGTIGAAWTFGQLDPNFTDRGSGYNYYNGSAWGAQPSSRIESIKTGWPVYLAVGNGEVVISHNGSTGLIVSSRAVKGSGAWTSSTLTGPSTTGGTTALLWPSAVANGNTIHLIACTDQGTTGNPYYYQSLNCALVYYRSVNGGLTWSAPAILTGMDAASIVNLPNRTGFSGDSYAWAKPVGNTVAFAVGSKWGGVFVMKSTDNGLNWTKIPVYNFPSLPTAPTPIVTTTDGSVACAINSAGDIHVVFGRLRVSDDSYSDSPPTSSYYPYTDGLIYWNENMSVMDSGLLSNDAQLLANGQYVAGMLDHSGDGYINFPSVNTGEWPFGMYGLSLTSMPQIVIDGANIHVTYASCREDKSNPGASPNEQLYRHQYYTLSSNNGASWSYPTDLNSDVIHDFDECVFGSLNIHNGQLHMIYQADDEPGIALSGDMDPYNTNYIYHLTWGGILTPTEEHPDLPGSGIMIYPNPATSQLNLTLTPGTNRNLLSIYNLQGCLMLEQALTSHSCVIDVSRFAGGIYILRLSGDTGLEYHKFIKK